MKLGTWLNICISHHQLLNQLRYYVIHDEKYYTEEAHPLRTLILSSVKNAFPDMWVPHLFWHCKKCSHVCVVEELTLLLWRICARLGAVWARMAELPKRVTRSPIRFLELGDADRQAPANPSPALPTTWGVLGSPRRGAHSPCSFRSHPPERSPGGSLRDRVL